MSVAYSQKIQEKNCVYKCTYVKRRKNIYGYIGERGDVGGDREGKIKHLW